MLGSQSPTIILLCQPQGNDYSQWKGSANRLRFLHGTQLIYHLRQKSSKDKIYPLNEYGKLIHGNNLYCIHNFIKKNIWWILLGDIGQCRNIKVFLLMFYLRNVRSTSISKFYMGIKDDYRFYYFYSLLFFYIKCL